MHPLWQQQLLWEGKSWKHIPAAAWFNWGSKHHGNDGWHWPGSTIRQCTESQEDQRRSAENKAKHEAVRGGEGRENAKKSRHINKWVMLFIGCSNVCVCVLKAQRAIYATKYSTNYCLWEKKFSYYFKMFVLNTLLKRIN